MNEEEIVCYQNLTKYITERKLIYTKLDEHDKSIDVMLNLIKKLSEKVKDLNSLLNGNLYETYKVYEELVKQYEGNCISKEKIRNKINELKDKEEFLSDEQGFWGDMSIPYKIELLEEILEEDE